jgi:hypothetical protein
LYCRNDWSQQSHEQADRYGYLQRHLIGPRDGERFGQHLGENENDRGHCHRRNGNSAFVENLQRHLGRDRRRENVHKGISEQQRSDEPLPIADKIG